MEHPNKCFGPYLATLARAWAAYWFLISIFENSHLFNFSLLFWLTLNWYGERINFSRKFLQTLGHLGLYSHNFDWRMLRYQSWDIEQWQGTIHILRSICFAPTPLLSKHIFSTECKENFHFLTPFPPLKVLT